MRSKQGLFVKIGRQGIEYDDERILGYDDWAMTAPTHDMLKLGYEGHGHKVHALLAYNQTSDNVATGNSIYTGGIQPYKDNHLRITFRPTTKDDFSFAAIGSSLGKIINQGAPLAVACGTLALVWHCGATSTR